MAYDILKGTEDESDFARGDAPPPDSWEWIGSAKPPTQAELDARKKKPVVATQGKKPVVVTIEERLLIVRSKPGRRLWPWLLGAGVFAGGVWYGRRH